MIEKYIIVLLIVIGFEALILCIAWEEIKALQRDYEKLWGPLSELLKKLSAIVER